MSSRACGPHPRDGGRRRCARDASAFSGKFRNLDDVSSNIHDLVAPLQQDLGFVTPPSTPEQRAKDREARRKVVTKVQTAFEAISKDQDLEHFFREAVDAIEDQQFRKVLVSAGIMLGISLVTSGIGNLVTKSVGRYMIAAEGVAAVEQLSNLAKFAVHRWGARRP